MRCRASGSRCGCNASRCIDAGERACDRSRDRANQVGLASAYEGLGQLDRAAAELRDVIEKHPDEPSLWALRQQLARIESRLAAAR